jgi:WD40-like Beta Propeller Repeat
VAVLVRLSAALAVALGSNRPSPAAAEPGAPSFVVEQNPFRLGQAADWLDRDHVVWHGPVPGGQAGAGEMQIYRSTLDGAEQVCLTCGLAGPNQVPVAQPHRGKWILFHSWNGHAAKIGSPGFGGIGSEVWVMRRNGRQRTNLTKSSELHDNFHAYWSPDGNYIAWTALNWNAAEGGNGKSDVRVARFVARGSGGPHLVGEHAVRPANGHWYETQWWAPDGSGFLYTETFDTAMNPELFFCRLPDREAGECDPVRLTDDPAWDEQAIFTPDMSRVLFMSSRNLPGAHNDWAVAASLLDLPADYDYALILPEFVNSFLQPIFEQATDLYEITLQWNEGHTRFAPGAIRRLTDSGDDGWVIPEFAWDPGRRRLLWTQQKFNDGRRVDRACVMRQLREAIVGRLSGVSTISQLPLDIVTDIRDRAAGLLRDPTLYPVEGSACGGNQPGQEPRLVGETVIGHFEPSQSDR